MAMAALAIIAGFPASAQVNNFSPALKVDFEIKGAIVAKGTTAVNIAAFSCADWAAGRPKINPKPLIEFMLDFDIPVDGQPFYTETLTRDYKGPGTYDATVLPLRIWVGGKSWELWGKGSADNVRTKFTIAADGSGSIAFEGYTSDQSGDPPFAEISGSLSWTCANPKAR
jgi:hypothetical protein